VCALRAAVWAAARACRWNIASPLSFTSRFTSVPIFNVALGVAAPAFPLRDAGGATAAEAAAGPGSPAYARTRAAYHSSGGCGCEGSTLVVGKTLEPTPLSPLFWVRVAARYTNYAPIRAGVAGLLARAELRAPLRMAAAASSSANSGVKPSSLKHAPPSLAGSLPAGSS
jgi:hypothetical protein